MSADPVRYPQSQKMHLDSEVCGNWFQLEGQRHLGSSYPIKIIRPLREVSFLVGDKRKLGLREKKPNKLKE